MVPASAQEFFMPSAATHEPIARKGAPQKIACPVMEYSSHPRANKLTHAENLHTTKPSESYTPHDPHSVYTQEMGPSSSRSTSACPLSNAASKVRDPAFPWPTNRQRARLRHHDTLRPARRSNPGTALAHG